MTKPARKKTTVLDLIMELNGHQSHKPVFFGGSPDGLTFNRVKDRGDYVQIEFDQQVYRDSAGQIVVEESERS